MLKLLISLYFRHFMVPSFLMAKTIFCRFGHKEYWISIGGIQVDDQGKPYLILKKYAVCKKCGAGHLLN